MLQSLFYLTTALHVSGFTITHLQEHKTTVTTASGNRYTVMEWVKFTDKEYIKIWVKITVFVDNVFLLKIYYLLFCAPEDGCWWWPKHVEQLSDKINSVTCASCWIYVSNKVRMFIYIYIYIYIYIRILLGCTDPWTLNTDCYNIKVW